MAPGAGRVWPGGSISLDHYSHFSVLHTPSQNCINNVATVILLHPWTYTSFVYKFAATAALSTLPQADTKHYTLFLLHTLKSSLFQTLDKCKRPTLDSHSQSEKNILNPDAINVLFSRCDQYSPASDLVATSVVYGDIKPDKKVTVRNEISFWLN